MTIDRLLAKLAYATIPSFWPIWLTVAAALLIIAVRTQVNWLSGARLKLQRLDASLLLIFLIPYISFMMWGVEFAYHDNDFFLELTSGRPLQLMIWPHAGRYFPLYMQEFNLFRHISISAAFFQLMVAIQLIVFCGLIAIALAGIGIVWRMAAVILLLCSNSLGIVFADPVYPEHCLRDHGFCCRDSAL